MFKEKPQGFLMLVGWIKKDLDALLDGVNIGENVIISIKKGQLWLRVIDYRKGYWAEVPLSKREVRKALRHIGAFLWYSAKQGLIRRAENV